jgi:hypothetical protein
MKKELALNLAGHVIGLRIDSEYEAPFVNNYELFLSNGAPELSIDVGLSCALSTVDSPDAKLTMQDNLITIVDDYLAGSLDLMAMQGEVQINPVDFLRSLGTFLRNICTLLVVLKDDGLVLHAVGILKKDEAYIFVGPSGAGKSTVAGLSLDKVVLSDDIVMIKKEQGEFRVFPTPCWGDKQRGPRQNRPYCIGAIFKLIQDKKVFIEDFSLSYSLADIFTIPHIPAHSVPKDEVVARFLELITTVPYRGLHFLPEPSFWGCIEKARLQEAELI